MTSNRSALNQFNGEDLSRIGLNLQAVFEINGLPPDIIGQLEKNTKNLEQFSQLILIGHAGQLFWRHLKRWQLEYSDGSTEHPVDDFSYIHCQRFFRKCRAVGAFEIIFPAGEQGGSDLQEQPDQPPIGLQQLGKMAGWHYDSPLRLGLNEQWGSWFAYRAVILVKANFATTPAIQSKSPCLTCESRACIKSCPADALAGGDLDINRCFQYRKRDNSQCKDRCIARMSCPVAKDHQYELEQIQYHYTQSMSRV